MTQVQRPIHVRKGEIPEPFREFFVDLCMAETCCFLLRRRVGFEYMRFLPLILILLLQGLQVVPFSCLSNNVLISNQAIKTRRDAPEPVRWYLTYLLKQRKTLIVQLFYSPESLTRGAKGRVLCWMK